MLQQLKKAGKSVLLRFGYEIRSVADPNGDDVDFKAALITATIRFRTSNSSMSLFKDSTACSNRAACS